MLHLSRCLKGGAGIGSCGVPRRSLADHVAGRGPRSGAIAAGGCWCWLFSLAEAAFSFLGVGTGKAYPTWGQTITQGRDVVTIAWWLPTFPGLAILVTVLSINLVGDQLREALDPRVS